MEKTLETLSHTYALYGFAPLDTPAIEAAEVLLAKAGGETEKQIYRFSKGESDLALRFDLTVPLAKYVAANYGRLTFPLRRYQVGKVWRGERAQRGRFREFYQADIDIIGDGSLSVVNEAEIPAVICHTFTALGLERFTIRINNRKVLNGFFEITGLGDQSGEIMRAVDRSTRSAPPLFGAFSSTTAAWTDSRADRVIEFIGFQAEQRRNSLFSLNIRIGARSSTRDFRSWETLFRCCRASVCGREFRDRSNHRPRSGLLYRDSLRDDDERSPGDRLHLLRRTL